MGQYSKDYLDEIKWKYKNKINVLRKNIIRMVPEEYQNILENYYCTTRKELSEYPYRSIERIIKIVLDGIKNEQEVEPEQFMAWHETRVFCPLCKEGNLNGTGLTVPVGLERHLKGYGNIQQCIVTEAAFDLARDIYYRDYKDKEEENNKIELEKRKNNEILFLVNPNDNPSLIESGLFLSEYRNPENLEWAFKRLEKMGFSKIKKDNVVSFQKDYENYVMFADPREVKRLTFELFIKPGKPLNKNKTTFKRLYGSNMYILDKWTKDLDKKVDERFIKAVGDV